MKTVCCSLALFLSALSVAACGSYLTGTRNFTAHEWGTFTSVQGADGVQLEWNPLVATDLPPFVHNPVRSLPHAPDQILPLLLAKPSLRARQRMETPVIYLYSDRERLVDVTVRFPQGHVTEWYPQVHPASFTTPGRIERLVWDRITVLPRQRHPEQAAQLPVHSAPSHYFPAREAEADFLRRSPGANRPTEVESLLFYRGLGHFNAPLEVTQPAGANHVRLRNTGGEPLAWLVVLQVKDGRAGFQMVNRLAPGAAHGTSLPCSRSLRPLAEVAGSVAGHLRHALVKEGLFEREAAAMVKTWRDSWFAEPGVRVLYTLPRAWTDRTLPLDIRPRPEQVVRVMVGRAEVITPATESAVRARFREFTEATTAERGAIIAATRSLGLGRFFEPALRRAGKEFPGDRFRSLEEEFLRHVSGLAPNGVVLSPSN